jgi:hypothetical protein
MDSAMADRLQGAVVEWTGALEQCGAKALEGEGVLES